MIFPFSRYHHKVPYDPPELTIKDKTFGLVSPDVYEMPERSPLWTAVAYAAFDIALDPDSKEAKANKVIIFLKNISQESSKTLLFKIKKSQKIK
jgi:hypothetical protein